MEGLKNAGLVKYVSFIEFTQRADLSGSSSFRSIGISNFSVKDTQVLLASAKIPPAVNQVRIYARSSSVERALRLFNLFLRSCSSLTTTLSRKTCSSCQRRRESPSRHTAHSCLYRHLFLVETRSDCLVSIVLSPPTLVVQSISPLKRQRNALGSPMIRFCSHGQRQKALWS